MRLLRRRFQLAAGTLVLLMGIAVQIAAQRGAPPLPPAAGAPAAQTPATPRGNPNATFPAQQRPPGDPALIARGNGLYGANCRLCHGADLRGGDQGGTNLLRSAVVLADQS